jgi:hypothetical protein
MPDSFVSDFWVTVLMILCVAGILVVPLISVWEKVQTRIAEQGDTIWIENVAIRIVHGLLVASKIFFLILFCLMVSVSDLVQSILFVHIVFPILKS